MSDEPQGFLDQEEEQEPKNYWLMTYADMVTLLLTFFILLFSMSSLDQSQFSESFTAIRAAIQGKETTIATSRITAKEASVLVEQVQLRRQIEQAQQRVFQDVRLLQTTEGVEGVLTAKLDKGKITLRLPSEVLFDSGSATLKPGGRVVLGQLKNFFIKYPDQMINIKGYTDDVLPSPTARFRDNWELSAMRAVNVLRLMVELGLNPNRMTATGLADLDPLLPNTSPENRAQNRRVEFVLEKIVE
ncbi:OmpA/MotB domain protein [Alkalidesulfovibrio alkalitolerans DSM 16529]|uniref:OmpA/MotB domain protein n=1 Tax=Alkalidesulfovibrio alkalitolerans DSM 16529 TaxID=1121439 RepID=S7UEI7_9BACT|nr:flagellar motor protein MotB [Alkalidesulfovibrio alkalitolerans]EPR30658.1 OmpA/MotB domain protein [Alkalidesulfovibrio alkalitolerans DSM 16529]